MLVLEVHCGHLKTTIHFIPCLEREGYERDTRLVLINCVVRS